MSQVSDFVNSHRRNVDLSERFDELIALHGPDGDDVMFELLPGEFISELGAVELDDAAFPVYAYLRAGEYVAWYDCENLVGYRSR